MNPTPRVRPARVPASLPRLVAALFLAAILPASAATYYVNASAGNDHPKRDGLSPGKAWKTLGYAVTRVPASSGHEILLQSGTHTIASSVAVPPGVGVRGEGIETTFVQSALSAATAIKLESSSRTDGDQTLSDFTLDGQNRALKRGVYSRNRDNVRLRNLRFRAINETAAELVSSGDATKTTPPSFFATGVVVENCVFENVSRDYSGYSTGGLQLGGLQGAVVSGCVFTEDAGYGIKFANFGWLKGVRILDNRFTLPAQDALWDLDCAVELWNLHDDCEVVGNTANTWFSFVLGNKGAGARSVLVADNVVNAVDDTVQSFELNLHDAEARHNVSVGANIGFASWAAAGNLSIHHNIVVGGPSDVDRGVLLSPRAVPVSGVRIYNNVFDGVWRGVLLTLGSDDSSGSISGVVARNNVFLNTGTAVTAWGYAARIADPVLERNYLHQVGATYATDATRQPAPALVASENVLADPGLRLGGSTWQAYYAPASSASPVVDAGLDLGLGHFGAAPDIGAIETDLRRFEAESLAVASAGASVSNVTDPAASGGLKAVLWSESDGCWAEFTLPGLPAGDYAIRARLNTWSARGIAQASLDGAAIGQPCDLYSADAGFVEVEFARVTFTEAGDRRLRFTVVGKNPASSSRKLAFDHFTVEAVFE